MFLQLKLNATVFFFKDTCDLRNHLLFSLNYELIVCSQRNNPADDRKKQKQNCNLFSLSADQ